MAGRPADTPESGVRPLTAKAKYRLQLKLQAALTRVGQVLTQFEKHKLRPNVDCVYLAAGIADVLTAIVPMYGRAPERGDFDPMLIGMLAKGVNRKRKETKKRGQRLGNQGLREPWKFMPR
jgi:hypothetical protein